jgi:hypothetical protein
MQINYKIPISIDRYASVKRIWGQMSICTETYTKAKNVAGQMFQLLAAIWIDPKIGATH